MESTQRDSMGRLPLCPHVEIVAVLVSSFRQAGNMHLRPFLHLM